MRNIKKIIMFTLLVFILMPLNASASNAFSITRYHIEMEVFDDNSYLITENIDVKFDYERHGIYRSIPTTSANGMPVKITEVDVNKPFEKIYNDEYLDIKIGSADYYADEETTYVIKYLYQRGKDGIDEYDELFFNLVGTEWDNTISNITFDITMPHDFDESKINFTYGTKGFTENELVIYTVEGRRIVGQLNKELSFYEGLTIALPLPNGYYSTAKSTSVEFIKIFDQYKMIILLGVAGLVSFLTLIFGRNRTVYPPVEFYPPKGLTPADIGYIYDASVDPQDVTSLVIYWAHRGYLMIEEVPHPKKKNKTEIYLHKLKDPDSTFKDYEEYMFRVLFNTRGNGDRVNFSDQKKTFYSVVNEVERKLLNVWKDNKETRIYSEWNSFFRFLTNVTGFLILVILHTLIFKQASMTFEWGYLEDYVVVIMCTILAWIMYPRIAGFTRSLANIKKTLPSVRFKRMFKPFFWLIVILGLYGYTLYIINYILVGSLGLLCVATISFVSNKIQKRTKTGDKFTERIMGFRNFILHAEKDKINMLINEDPRYFFNVLPYAVVFGVTDKWASKFTNIKIPQPDWYASQDKSNFYYDSFAYASIFNEINNEVTRYTSSSTSYGSSSWGGSDDGGFSGGGDGGGGGSDW